MKTLALLGPCIFLLSACTAPLVPVTYDQQVSVQSNLPAAVQLNTGIVAGHGSTTMVPAGGIFVPVSTGPNPEFQFAAEDQATFVESLKTELVRHGIFRAIEDVGSSEAFQIVVNFVHTEHYPSFQEYKLTVSMLMAYRDMTAQHRYEVLSSEGDSTWEKWNTDASKGKKKAAVKLLNLLMADIQAFTRRVLEEAPKDESDVSVWRRPPASTVPGTPAGGL